MTTEHTDTALPNEPLATYRRLERRTSNRVIGGVAGGLADYLNVDPLLIRVGFAGLMLFSGAGIPLYLLGWLFIPLAGHPDSLAMGWLRSFALRPSAVVVLGIFFILLVLSFPVYRRLEDFTGFYVPGEIWIAFAIVIVGMFLLLPRGQGGSGAARPPAAPSRGTAPSDASALAASDASAAAVAAPSTYWTPAPPAPAVPAEPPAPASPLGWWAVATMFIGVGLVALLDNNVPTLQVEVADYFGVALLAIGVGLVIGAVWGRARGLILIGLAILPFALGSSFVRVPLDGGFGGRFVGPNSPAELAPTYRVTAGDLYFNLAALEGQTDPVNLSASVGIGQITVILPRDASIDVTGSVGAGRLHLFDGEFGGTRVSQRVVGDGAGGGAHIVLNLDVGIGDVAVFRADRQFFDELGG